METLEQRLQKLVPGRTAPAAAPAPGTTATKTVLNKPGARPDLKYTPSPMDTKVREIESAIGRFVPDFIKDFGKEQEQKGFAEALLPGAVMNAPGLGGLLPRVVAGGATELIAPRVIPGATVKTPPAQKDKPLPSTYTTMGVEYDSATGQALNPDTKKISSGGYSIDPSGGARTDYGSGDARGVDTSTAQRESLRKAGGDPAYAAWAAANPTLAANLVKKVENRRMKNPEYTQVGYDQAKKQVDPSYNRDVSATNIGPVADGATYARNIGLRGTEGRGPVADGGLYADMIGGKQKPNAQSFKDKAMKKVMDAPAESLPPSTTQNPAPAGGDGTPIDSELELANTAYAKEKYVRDPIKDMMVLVE